MIARHVLFDVQVKHKQDCIWSSLGLVVGSRSSNPVSKSSRDARVRAGEACGVLLT